MAGVTSTQNVWEQLGLVAHLRWRQFYNLLHKPANRWGLVAQAAIRIIGGLLIAFIGLGMGTVAFLTLTAGNPRVILSMLTSLLTIVFVFWHVLPIVTAAMQGQYDFSGLLRYPLRFSTFVLLNLGSALMEEGAVASLFWLACILAGVLVAQPALLFPLLFWIPLFLVFNLFLNRLLLSVLESILLNRRRRERFFVVVAALFLGFLGLVALLERWDIKVKFLFQSLAVLLRPLPPMAGGRSLAGAATGDWLNFAEFSAWMAAGSLFCAWWLLRRYRLQYQGEVLEQESTEEKSFAGIQIRPGWEFPAISSKITALVQKDFQSYGRMGILWVSFVAVPLMVLLYSTMSQDARKTGFFGLSSDLAFPAVLAYLFFSFMAFPLNVFGYDRHGIQLLLFSPVNFRSVLLAKNITFTALVLLQSVVIWASLHFLVAPLTFAGVVAAYLSVFTFLLLILSVGNLTSVFVPRNVSPAKNRSGVHPLATIAGLILLILFIGASGYVFYFAHRLDSLWFAALVFLALVSAAYLLYRRALDFAAQAAYRRSQTLLDELCGV